MGYGVCGCVQGVFKWYGGGRWETDEMQNEAARQEFDIDPGHDRLKVYSTAPYVKGSKADSTTD